MNENAWEGLDPDIRAQAAEAAAALGVSLEDYLTELLLEQALETILQEPDIATPEPEAPARAPSFVPPIGKTRENFAVRHRLDALDRRIAIAVGSLDNAINTVDGSVLSLASRVDETEAVFGEASETLSHALNDLSDNLNGVREQLAAAEGGLSALNNANSAAHADLSEKYADLDQRLAIVDDLARDTDRAAADLTLSFETLKQAVVEDFAAFSHETHHRIGVDLDELRNAAIAAANHADSAAAHVINELRVLRETVEGRMAETASETQARMQAAFADSAALYTNLYGRLSDHERAAAAETEHVRARLIDIEDAGQTALEDTAEGLRAAHSALAVDVARVSNDARVGLETLRNETTRDLAAASHGVRTNLDQLRAEIAHDLTDLRDGQAGTQARLKLVDSAVANTIGDIAAVRDTIERRVGEASAMARAELAQAREGWSGRFDALAARLSDSESDAAHAHHIATAETHRVEASTLAALEKLAQDRAALESVMRLELGEAAQARASADNALRRELNDAAQAAHTHTEEVRQRLQHDVAAVRGQQAGVQARVDAIAASLSADGQIGAALKRLPAIEAALESTQTEATLAALRAEIDAIAARLGDTADENVLTRVEDARARLAAHETRGAETADRVHGLARLFGRLSAQSADAATQTEDRLHKLELAFADLRLEHYSGASGEAPAPSELVAAFGARLAELEQRQADALEQLRADITQFLGENDRRLSAIESDDVGAEFQSLRQRVEERLIEAERKSVRALEQVMETVALIGRKLTGGEEARAATAKSA